MTEVQRPSTTRTRRDVRRRRAHTVSMALLTILAFACTELDRVSPTEIDEPAFTFASHIALAQEVRTLAAGRNIGPVPPAPPVRLALMRLGQFLLFDRILSGNRDIACMTCHHPTLGTSDARSLSIGQGATGLGENRVHPDGAFIPRNAPALFNLHLSNDLFWDGRVSVDDNGAFHTPAGAALTPHMEQVFEFGAISALGLFPVTSREEMRAFGGNELAAVADGDFQGIWGALMNRLGQIPHYRYLFELAYPGTDFDDMTFAHASNAMAGFLVSRLNHDLTPWDRFLNGADFALSGQELRGAQTFMTLNCGICHGGPGFSTGAFANVAMAQIGPGVGDGAGNDDFGRARVTGNPADNYRFKTPQLRNVVLTGPWGHAGQFTSLRDFVDHYSESDIKLFDYDASQLEPLLQGTLVTSNFQDILGTRSGLLNGFVMTPAQVDDLTAFMSALTDPRALYPGFLIPLYVPSGLPVDR